MLIMKTECERCQVSLSPADPAFICSFECTYCHSCCEAMDHICCNCQGELAPRPTRLNKSLKVPASELKNTLFC